MLRRRLRLRPLNAASYLIHEPGELDPVAADLAARLGRGDVIYLEGPIGVGKTTFAQALARALGVGAVVTSPTYVLVHRYAASIPVTHVDLYRLESSDDRALTEIAAEIDPATIALVEWPERGRGVLPPATWTVRLAFGDGAARRLEIAPGG